MLTSEMVTARNALEPLSAEWDALAVACDRPQMAPGFVLSWWRHVAPSDARPRLVAVRDGDLLVGVAPFYVEPSARRARTTTGSRASSCAPASRRSLSAAANGTWRRRSTRRSPPRRRTSAWSRSDRPLPQQRLGRAPCEAEAFDGRPARHRRGDVRDRGAEDRPGRRRSGLQAALRRRQRPGRLEHPDPPGPRRPLTRAHTAPMRMRYTVRDAAKRVLTDEQADRLRALRAHLPSA